MLPAFVLGGLVAASLLLIAVTLGRVRRPAHRRARPFRASLPWIALAVVVVGGALVVVPGVPAMAVVGLMAYTAVAAAATFRMASLDATSPWMTPSQRRARIGFTVVALTWLGIVLGLLLRIADLLASYPFDS